MPIPESLLSAHRPYSSAKVVCEKCFGPRVGQTRALVMPAITRLGRKSVIEPGIIVQRHPGVRAERIVHGLLRFGPDEMIGGGNVQHQRAGDGVHFTQHPVDHYAVITHRSIDNGAGGRTVSKSAAKAVSHAEDRKSTRLNSSH